MVIAVTTVNFGGQVELTFQVTTLASFAARGRTASRWRRQMESDRLTMLDTVNQSQLLTGGASMPYRF